MWPIGVTKSGKHIYLENGWEKFIEDNIVELGDFFIFYYDGIRTFDFKLLRRNGCVKKGVGGSKLVVKEEETDEMNVEHQKSVDPKENTWARDNKSIFSNEDRDGANMVEDKEDEEKECEKTKKVQSKDEDKEEEDDKDDEEDEYKEEDKEEKERIGIFNKKAPRSKEYQLELPSNMTIRDSSGKEFEAKLKIWKDGRIWLVGGWRSLCRLNLLEKNDTCICEFVRAKHNKGLYLQVYVFHEGEGSHPNKK
uniref:DNA binding protein n=1 Tax=Solanum tuberosum TaxID=4113 RepID=M1DEX7_SOLTU